MSYRNEVMQIPLRQTQVQIVLDAAEIAARADTRIAELEAEIARLRDALDLSALEYADLAVSAKSLEEHLHALVEVSEDSTIARARAVMNGDDIGEDEDEGEARAGNGGAG